MLCGLALLACVACGAHFDGRVYRAKGVAFAVSAVPAAWQPLPDRDAALALKALPQDIGVSDGIKLALKALAK